LQELQIEVMRPLSVLCSVHNSQLVYVKSTFLMLYYILCSVMSDEETSIYVLSQNCAALN